MPIVTAASQTSENLQETPWAFISFVPDDLPWCDWLYFTLHGYPVPAALAVHATKYGFPLPDNITAFPDPNDPAHIDHLEEAVSCARYLIVVVSPHSAHSAQIDEHIRSFKRGGGEERIIALVVEGPPLSSSSLCVRSDDQNWLPLWLQWRLQGDGTFKSAGPTEPLIIDARPGYANLDDVMTVLIAVLLDVPREELELLEALTPGDAAVAVSATRSARADLAAAALEDLEKAAAVPIAGDQISGAKRRISPAAIIVVLVLIAGIAVVAGFLARQGGEKPVSAVLPISIDSTPDEAPLAPVTEKSKGVEAPSVPVVAAIPEIPEKPAEAPVANLPEEQMDAPESPEKPVVAETESRSPGVVVQSEPPPFAAEAYSPAPSTSQGEREIAVRLEKEALMIRAEELMRRGELESAIEVYERALGAVQRFASLPSSRPAAKLEVARVCRILGALQMRYASSMEARQTYERGRKALQKLKLSKQEAKERSELLSDLEAGLRQVGREIE